MEEPLQPLCERFWNETARYWQTWVKQCDIPPLFQREVIRSALALKLHCFEDTGAMIAAMTTSIPESPGSGRTWDYRYCWLRDSYYALNAFGLLGQFRRTGAVCSVSAERRWRSTRTESGAALPGGRHRRTSTKQFSTIGPVMEASDQFESATPPLSTPSTTSTAKWCWRSRRSSLTNA